MWVRILPLPLEALLSIADSPAEHALESGMNAGNHSKASFIMGASRALLIEQVALQRDGVCEVFLRDETTILLTIYQW